MGQLKALLWAWMIVELVSPGPPRQPSSGKGLSQPPPCHQDQFFLTSDGYGGGDISPYCGEEQLSCEVPGRSLALLSSERQDQLSQRQLREGLA